MKIVVTRDIGKEALGVLAQSGHQLVCRDQVGPAPRQWVLDNVKGAHAICVSMSDKVDSELLDAAGSQLKAISTFSVGYDHIDVLALRHRNIRLGYTPDVLNDAVADTAVMLVLMATRRAGEAISIVKDGKWPQTPWSPFLLTGPALSSPNLTIGFLGFGRISHAVLDRLLAFTRPVGGPQAPRCLYTTSGARPDQKRIDEGYTKRFGIQVQHVEKDELARDADVLIVLCSLTTTTTNLVGEEFIGRMKSTSVLINCARGPVVDSDALAAALRVGKIFGAGLDVVAGEPNITADHPLVKEPRCIVLPHIGSATIEARQAMADLCARNALAGAEDVDMPSELKA